MDPPNPAARPVAEIERRLNWRVISIVAFAAMMALLAVVAAITVMVPPRLVGGLPDDPDVIAASAALHGRLAVGPGPLRFRSALAGDAPFDGAGPPECPAEQVAPLLERARARHRDDPRLEVALAHLDLACRRIPAAERRYRAVVERGVDAPEARLGLGLALAALADAERDPERVRGLRLEAIAQLLAVDPRDPVHPVALYDRALLLDQVGRRAEALRALREYEAVEPDSAWVVRLRRALQAPA